MSFKIIEQAKPRLNRSELAVPGSNPSLFEKAAKSKVDVIFLDLEDAVAPDEKEQARKNILPRVSPKSVHSQDSGAEHHSLLLLCCDSNATNTGGASPVVQTPIHVAQSEIQSD